MSVYSLISQLNAKKIKLWQENGQLKFKAPKGALSDELRRQIIDNKQPLIDFFKQVAGATGTPSITKVDKAEFPQLPLSFSQERMWFMSQLDPNNVSYNIPLATRITADINVEHVEQAMQQIIDRHDNLRTTFPSIEGQTYQKIAPTLTFKLQMTDLSDITNSQACWQKAKKMCQQDAATPFDLAVGPLVRGRMFKLGQKEYIFMLNMHHIISDGWSMGVFFNEFRIIMAALAVGQKASLAPLPIQYADFSVWQRKWLEQGGVLKQQLDYWQQKLGGVPESLDLVTDYPRPSVQSFVGAAYRFSLDSELTDKLNALAKQQGSTLYMMLLAVFKVLLYRYTGQEDICLGSPIANRQHEETEGLIGVFINTLAMRTQLTAEHSFTTVLGNVQTTCLQAYENQDTPFEKVVDLVLPQRNIAVNPIYQHMMVLQNSPLEISADTSLCDLELQSSNLDQIIEFTETPNGISGVIEYITALYKATSIERQCRHFVALCEAVVAEPDKAIGELDYLDDSEKQQLLEQFNQTTHPYVKDQCLHQLFAEQAKANPDHPAVIFEQQQLSYAELYQRCHTLALYLQSKGIVEDDLVGLCMERSCELMVAIEGTLLAGGAYMPLDPEHPDDRLAYMIKDSAAKLVLTQAKFVARVKALVGDNTEVVALDSHWEALSAAVDDKAQLRQIEGTGHLAYVIYTSGSTGQPKGVMVEHQALVNRIDWMQREYQLNSADVVLQKTPFSFDVSVWEFVWPLMAGATVVFARPDGHKDADYLEQLIEQAGVTTLHFVPSMFNIYLHNAKKECTSVRQIFCSGEALDSQLVDEYRSKFPNAGLYNLYGPTEAAIDVTAFDCAEQSGMSVPIGSPISNIQIYILDPSNRPQSIGMPGELHIAGDGLARGYLNNQPLTDEKFVANPFNPATRMYKSGDLARWLDDGTIEYLGRIDTQVKIRGFRIEIGEIETRLNQYLDIKNCAVVVQGQQESKQLIAFYESKDSTGESLVQLDNEQLRKHLLVTLPEYMLPSAFVSLGAIPLTPSGKVNRRALQNIDVTLESSEAHQSPSNETEQQLVDIWAQVLGLAAEKIGVNDNFFERGGNSLLAVKLVAKINARFDTTMAVAKLFTAPTVAALAKLVGTELGSAAQVASQVIVPLQTKGTQTPIFGMPGADGNVMSLLTLSNALGTAQPFYGLQSLGLDGKSALLQSVEAVAKVNIEALKTLQSEGPYRLLGYSYGGVVAFEMARMLLAEGQQVADLMLLDTASPSLVQEKVDSDELTMLFEGAVSIAKFKFNIDLRLKIEQLERTPPEHRFAFVSGVFAGHGLDIDSNELTGTYRQMKTMDACVRAYSPKPLDKPLKVMLFRATEQLVEMPEGNGWNELLVEPVRVHEVKANHYSMIEPQPIEKIAKHMRLAALAKHDV